MRHPNNPAPAQLILLAALSCWWSGCSDGGAKPDAARTDGASDADAVADSAARDVPVSEDVGEDVGKDVAVDGGVDAGVDESFEADSGADATCAAVDITSQWTEVVPFGYLSVASDRSIGLNGYEEGRATYSAGFYETHPAPCSFQVVTPQCVLQQCAVVTPPRQALAGLIAYRVSGAQKYLLSYNYTAYMYQSAYTSDAPWSTGGLPLEIEDRSLNPTSGTGYIPHFIVDLVTPARMVLTEPVLSADVDLATRTPHTIVRAQGMNVRWTGTCPGVVRVTVSAQTPTTRYHAICRFAPAAGTAHVPPEILSQLPAGGGSMTFNTAVEQIVSIEGWRILAAGTTGAVLPSNRAPYSQIELQ